MVSECIRSDEHHGAMTIFLAVMQSQSTRDSVDGRIHRPAQETQESAELRRCLNLPLPIG